MARFGVQATVEVSEAQHSSARRHGANGQAVLVLKREVGLYFRVMEVACQVPASSSRLLCWLPFAGFNGAFRTRDGDSSGGANPIGGLTEAAS